MSTNKSNEISAAESVIDLASLGIELPQVPVPCANFIPWKRHGDLIYLAGQVCEWNGSVLYKGKVGNAYDLKTAQQAARVCMLNLLAVLSQCLENDLSRIRNCVRVGGFVNCVPDYPDVPLVVNGASDLLVEVFGREIGSHVRTAVGVAQLPQNASVEIDAIFEITS